MKSKDGCDIILNMGIICHGDGNLGENYMGHDIIYRIFFNVVNNIVKEYKFADSLVIRRLSGFYIPEGL